MTRTRTMRGALALSLAAALAVPAVASAQQTQSDYPDQSAFQKVTLNDRPGEAMSLAVLPDNRVLHSARTGEIRIHNPRTGLNTLVADMKTGPKGLYQHDEEGMQGIAVDEDFAENQWVYVYYSPKLNTPVDVPGTGINEGDAPEDLTAQSERDRLRLFAASPTTAYLQLSRFKLRSGAASGAGGSTGATLDFASEQEILRVPADRGICCHVGGQIEFDGDGNLYLSTGDDTNPFQSAGYTPIDDRANRNPAFDARRTSGSTNDLRGKVLRIRVGENGGYSVPNGNLFRRGTSQTRAEIYAMGLRNPFRFSVNKTNGDIYMADYSPDASAADPARGPEGHGRWMLIRQPGNYGWPYCVTPTIGYVDYDFTPDAPQSGQEFNCSGRVVNDSRNNTGQRVLPPVVQPDVYYSFGGSTGEANALFPELMEQAGGNGVSPMAGPAYQFDRTNRSPNRFPRVFDGQPLFYEWSRDYAKVFELNRPNGGRLSEIHHLFGGRTNNNVDDPSNPNIILDNPMDMEFGPDGALYVLEYGDGYFSENPEAQLARIDFVRGQEYTPRVRVAATPTTGTTPPLTVQFSSAGTVDLDGDRIVYAWDFNGDGVVDSRVANPTFTYTDRGVYEATLRVADSTGRSASSSVRVTVGNTAPVVRLQVTSTSPPFGFGDTVNYTVTVTDDQPVDCSRVSVAYILGHDAHGHPQTSTTGCTGTLSIPVDTSHQGLNIAAVFVATYADAPAGGEESQQGSAEVVLRPAAAPTNQG